MRGRKPQPTTRRVLDGNPGRRPLNAREPKPPALDPAFDTPPVELAHVPAAAVEWARLAPMLRTCRQITHADRSALIALCLEWSRYLAATAQIQAEGLVLKTTNGYPVANPHLNIATRALAGCHKLWPELGLTPSSRTRLATTEDLPTDPFAEFDRAS